MIQWLKSVFRRDQTIDKKLEQRLDKELDKLIDDLPWEGSTWPVNVLINKPYDELNAEFLASAHNVYQSEAFKLVLEHIVDDLIQHGVCQAIDWDGVKFDRASINGVNLVIEEFERLESLYQSLHQKPELFNKHEII